MNVLRDAGRTGFERTVKPYQKRQQGLFQKEDDFLRQVSNDGRILM